MAQVIEQEINDRFALYHGDSVEVIRGIPDASVGYTIFSPPFSSLYTYSNSERDLGNCRND
ncbi:MAG: site-specific DNA-methyltransferase, partial [Ignavibacteriales bacterium]|nr:site-specific DNA-methyltransferase [Ignavibacteriales bacterium]